MITVNCHNAPLVILIINMFIAQLGVGLIIPVLPKYMQLFAASGAVLGYLVSAMGLTLFLFSPLAGELSDRYGRKRAIVFGLSMFCLSQYLFGAASELWLLYVSRLIGGIGIAFTSPAITAYIADITTEDERGKGMSWLSAAMALGIVIGPGVGGVLAEYDLRLPFYFAAVASALSMLASILVLPETLSPKIKTAAGKAEKKQPRNVLRHFAASFQTPYLSLLVLFFILTFALVNVEVVFGLYLAVKYGYTPQDIAILFTVGAAAGVIIQALFMDWLLRRFGEQQVIRLSLSLAAIALLLLLVPKTYFMLLSVTVFFFSFTAALRPALTTLLSKLAGAEQGFAAGLSNAYTSLAIIAGPAAAGLLFDLHTDLPYLFGAVLMLASLAVPLKERQPETALSAVQTERTDTI
ncbi:MFS transporter|uniref:MFS transporter, DHA1 family, multidrug resistance protein n=1 Tax=Dendrosporobacter quercicolus TaxID=146817 RepID=A0A1G9MUX1_9FIRM|nr:MFS transporter [Dendrosporobacter quercicolus]NSL47148.1 MFS transporter [Dendrosporobacter quercicolus DSM 1736]SDL78072.1 MFS transporter, DHA1 family, multidrug resistance protein [Dendrosporobacter quercicolus]